MVAYRGYYVDLLSQLIIQVREFCKVFCWSFRSCKGPRSWSCYLQDVIPYADYGRYSEATDLPLEAIS